MRLLIQTGFPILLLSAAVAAVGGAQGLKCALAPVSRTEADAAFTAGDFARAEELFKAQLATAPTVANHAGLVRVQLERNELAEAQVSARAARSALPGSAEATAIQADVLLRAGDIPGASSAYLEAIASDRCLARAHFGWSRLNNLVGRHASAAKELQFAHRLAPGDPEITMAWLELLPPEQRALPLGSLLRAHPALSPERLEALSREVAVLDQRLTCQAEPFDGQVLSLEPILQDGRRRRSWGLQVRLNEAALPLLELDSSVDGIVLNPADAVKAHVRPLTSVPTDRSASYTAVAEEVHIGPLTYRNCPVTVVPSSAVDERNSLIGTNFFRDHVLHLDYVAATLRLTPLPALPAGATEVAGGLIAPEEKDWSPVYIAGPHVLLPTLINKKGPFLFALDTGIGASVLSPAVTATQLSSSKDATVNLKGSSGSFVKVIPRDGGGVVDVAEVRSLAGDLLPVTRPLKLPVYRFATTEIPDDTAVSFNFSPISHADGVEIAGLLGFHILSYFSFEINYRDALAHVVFDQNRRYHVQNVDRTY